MKYKLNESPKLFLLVLLSILSLELNAQTNQDSVIKAINKMPDDTNKVIVLSNLVQELLNSDPKAAMQLSNQAIMLSKKIKYPYGEMKSYSLLGMGYMVISNYDTARMYLLKTIEIAKKINNQEGLAISLGTMGNIYYFQSKYPDAIEWWLKAKKIDEDRHDTLGMVSNLSNIGAVYLELGNQNQAMNYFKKALSLNLASKELRNRAEILSNIANIYSEQNKIDSAESFVRQALEVSIQINNVSLQSSAYLDLSSNQRRKNQPLKALEYAQQALVLSRKNDNPDNIAFAQLLIGKCLNDLTEKKYYEWIERNFNGNTRKCMLTALAYHDSALVIYKELNMPNRLLAVYESKSAVQIGLGDGIGAYQSFKFSADLKDSLFNIELDRKLAQNTMQYEFDKKQAIAKSEQDKKDADQRNQLIILIAIGLGLIILAIGLWRRLKFIRKTSAIIQKEKDRSEALLLNILPEEVATELKAKGEAEAKLIDEVTVLFTDFKGFTAVSEILSPKELVRDLHECFTAFDNIIQKHGLEKIKTIGDSYMAAGGLPTPNKTHSQDVVSAGLEIRKFMEDGKAKKIAANRPYFDIRIGVHTGPVVAGIVGVKKFSYDIWGDTVNTASRMESSGESGKVNISGTTYDLVKDKFNCEHRGKITAKGKGEIDMYFVEATS